MQLDQLVHTLLATAAFVLLGLVFFAIAFFIIVKVTPFSLRKEIEEDQNTSLGIIIGSMLIGLALIISAAMR